MVGLVEAFPGRVTNVGGWGLVVVVLVVVVKVVLVGSVEELREGGRKQAMPAPTRHLMREIKSNWQA